MPWSFPFNAPLPTWAASPLSATNARNGVYYVGGNAVTLQAKRWNGFAYAATTGASGYTVRDYWGNIVGAGPVVSGACAPVPTAGGSWQPGWYRVYYTGPNTDVNWGASYGTYNFIVAPQSSNLPVMPTFPPFVSGGGGGEYRDLILKACMGMGTSRLIINRAYDSTFSTDNLASDLTDAGIGATWYLNAATTDPNRPRHMWCAFPNGTVDTLGTPGTGGASYFSWLFMSVADPALDGSKVFVSQDAGTASGFRIRVYYPNASTLVETYDNQVGTTAGANACASAIRTNSNYIKAWPGGFTAPNVTGMTAPTAIGNQYFNGVSGIVAALYASGVTHFEGPSNEPSLSDIIAHFMAIFQASVHAGHPNAKAIGPSPVTITYLTGSENPAGESWTWKAFLDAGGGNYCDEIAFHAYNSIPQGDLNAGRYTIEAFQALLAKYGLQNKTLWQTESTHAITCGYGIYYPRRARISLLQTLLWEQYGVPRERDNYWYEESHGFWGYPAFFESGIVSSGDGGSLSPQPAIHRTLGDETWGKPYASRLLFGGYPGDAIFIGSIYTNPTDHTSTVALATTSYMPNSTVTLACTTGGAETIGNQTVGASQGQVNVTTGSMWLSKWTAPGTGTITSMSGHFATQTATSGTTTFYLYTDAAGSPGTEVGRSTGFSPGANKPAQWWTDTASLAVTAGSTYWLGVGVPGSSSTSGLTLDYGPHTGSSLVGRTAGSNPATGGSSIGVDLAASVYATVSAPVTALTGSVTSVDAFGNTTVVALDGTGHVTVPVTDIGTYVRLPAYATATVYSVNDWPQVGVYGQGANGGLVAAGRLGTSPNPNGKLSDNKFMTGYYGGTITPGISYSTTGSLPDTATLTWETATRVDRVIIWCGPPWQSIATLTDFDVQTTTDGGVTWTTQATVTKSGTNGPSSFLFGSTDQACQYETFWDEQWVFDVKLTHAQPIVATGVRIYARGTSYGGQPDVTTYTAWPPSNGSNGGPQCLVIEEIAVLCDANTGTELVVPPPSAPPAYPQFLGDGYAVSATYSYPSNGGTFTSDTHWGDWDHAEVPADGALQIVSGATWTRSGYAMRVQSQYGQAASGDGSVDRVELTGQNLGGVPAGWGDGTDMWWAYAVMLDPTTFATGLPTKSGNPIWFLTHQFFNENLGVGSTGTSAGSPGLDIELSSGVGFLISFRAGQQTAASGNSATYYAWLVGNQPAELGVGHQFLIRYRYSSGSDGQLQVYYRLGGTAWNATPHINLYAGQNVGTPVNALRAGSVSRGNNIFDGITARIVNSPNPGEVVNYYPEGGTYRQRPDIGPSTRVVYQGGLWGRYTRADAEGMFQ